MINFYVLRLLFLNHQEFIYKCESISYYLKYFQIVISKIQFH